MTGALLVVVCGGNEDLQEAKETEQVDAGIPVEEW